MPWLFDANWAKVSVILVSVWLTVPYFFLVSMGALQAIPEELNEAARVDGGGPLQLFRRVTLPLLLVAVSPLLIASFAFNFNNFNNIYLLTSGGPPMGESSIAGSTDILISYTYKLAIADRQGPGLRARGRLHDRHLPDRRDDLGGLLLPHEGTGEHQLSVITAALERVRPRALARRERKRRPKLRDTWWRHIVGIVAVLVSLFPIWFVASAAFNRDNSVSGTSFLPTHFTLHNFSAILLNHVPDRSSTGYVSSSFLRWFANMIGVALGTAFLTVVLGALAAYAFSRFRFRGRRMGMLVLLLIQMFPQLLLVVAIYLIVLNVGGILPIVHMNSLTTLMLVYLGGAMGVNTWLMKGFFDTIPSELDESARVDGATAGQIFWGVVLPLAAPMLAVIGLISFVSTINEYVIASAILQTQDHFTLAVGMRSFIDQQFGQRWGPFAAGCADRRDPGGGAVHVAAEVDGQRPDAGLRQGMSAPASSRTRAASRLAAPHHDGSELYVLERPEALGGEAVVRLRAPRGRGGAGAAPLHGRRRAADGRGRGRRGVRRRDLVARLAAAREPGGPLPLAARRRRAATPG